ncbi:branched-chain amino acid ABC transporter permease [Candidatus Uhrbacteria bacterium]|nr:branched-chain amino acid ABC transporter permease [Candidatus Uhrbacteria bacterium]
MEIIAQIIANSLIAGSIYALVALSFNLMYATGKFFNLAIGGLIPIGGYTVLAVTVYLGLPVGVGILAGVVGTGIAGLLLDRLIYAPLRKRQASSLTLLIASLGAFTFLQAALALLFTSSYQTLPTLIDKNYSVFGAQVTAVQLILIISAVACTLGMHILLRKTSFGTAVRAMSDDLEVSKIIGIDTEKIFCAVFFIAGAILGYVGVLVGFDVGLDPLMGFFYMVAGIVGAIVGGMGEVLLGYPGSIIEGVLHNTIIYVYSAAWGSPITFVLIIIFLLFRPRGLFRK